MPEALHELPRVIAVPSDRLWLDPPFVLRVLYTQIRDVTLAGASVVLGAPLNAARWAIGFVPGTISPTTPAASPWADVSVAPGWSITLDPPLWFTLQLHGPLVMGEWYVSAGGPGIIRVIEVIRQS